LPVIAQIDGVNAVIYHLDHEPPHVHFRSADFQVKMEIETGKLVRRSGVISGKMEKALRAWVNRHQERLMELWDLASQGEAIEKV